MDTTKRTAAEVAERMRNGAAWWRLAAEALEDGRTEDAHNFARMGEFGLEGIAADLGTVGGRGQP